VGVEVVDQTSRPVCLFGGSGVVFEEKPQKLFEIVQAVLVIKVEQEGDWSQREYLNAFCLAIDLQVLYQLVL
jgi:hypothetical protein